MESERVFFVAHLGDINGNFGAFPPYLLTHQPGSPASSSSSSSPASPATQNQAWQGGHFQYQKHSKNFWHTKLQQKRLVKQVAFIGFSAFPADNLLEPVLNMPKLVIFFPGKSGKWGSLGFKPSSIAGGMCFRLRDLWYCWWKKSWSRW